MSKCNDHIKFSTDEADKIKLKGDMRLVMEISNALMETLKKEVIKRENKTESTRDVIHTAVSTLYINVISNILRNYIGPDKWDHFLDFCRLSLDEGFKEAKRIAKESLT